MDWKPNTEGMNWFLTKVWSIFSTKYPDQKMHLAGRKMPEHFTEMGNDSLIIHGEVESAYDFMSLHEVMLVPLFSGSGLRIKIIEAMAMRKCIIATPLAASGIAVSDNIHIMIADGVAEFIQCMETCKNNPQEVIRIAENAQQFAIENYDNKILADRVYQHYKNLL